MHQQVCSRAENEQILRLVSKFPPSTRLRDCGQLPIARGRWHQGSKPLPPGLKLSATGVISGKPTKKGIYPFTVKIVDTKTPTKPVVQVSATKALSIVIG
jgi:hypothetical protein